MPIVQAKCENCGGILAVDNNQKAAICPFCNTPYVVQDAINNYNITNNVNVGAGAVVNVYGNQNNDFEIEAGKLVKYKGASTDVIIPDTVKNLNMAIFEGMEITSITIPASVKTINYICFGICEFETHLKSLERIDVSPSNDVYYSIDGVLFEKTSDGDNLMWYPGCKKDEQYDIPDAVTKIDTLSFSHNCYITSISIPNSVKKIGDFAFRDCNKLKNILIPDSALIIGSEILSWTAYADDERHWISGVLYNGKCLLDAKASLNGECRIIEGTRVIASGAFAKCSPAVILTNSIISINSFAFSYDDKKHIVGIKNRPSKLIHKTDYSFYGTADIWEPPVSSSTDLPKKKNGCYVATAVYGSYDCPQVWALRRYRDYRLDATWYGKLFIMIYYAISPTIVKWFGKTKWFKKMWKGKLDRMVERLKAEGYEDTPYNDKY